MIVESHGAITHGKSRSQIRDAATRSRGPIRSKGSGTADVDVARALLQRREMATRKKKSSRRYGKKAGKKVQRSMEEMKSGKLRSGRSGKKVTSRKQAIAIGLSEARRGGAKVPARKKRTKKATKKGAKKRTAKRSRASR